MQELLDGSLSIKAESVVKGKHIDSGEQGVEDTERQHQWNPSTSIFQSPSVFRDLVLLRVASGKVVHSAWLIDLKFIGLDD